ncbi:MAG: amidohydrolase, partial [Bacteroidota bacterium]|nr:amidohydrolase [Bacteroidota bacterium]
LLGDLFGVEDRDPLVFLDLRPEVAKVILGLGGEAALHLFGLGRETSILNLSGTRSKEEILARVAERVAQTPRGRWIVGRGWDQNDWPLKAFPHRRDLDGVAPEHPLFLKRVDGHAAWVNSRALALTDIRKGTPDPPGGKILHDARGVPTGILLDAAVDLVARVVPQPMAEERRAIFLNGVRVCLAAGIGCAHDMGLTETDIAILVAEAEAGALPFRLVGYIDGTGSAWEDLLRTGRRTYGDDRFTLAGLKMYADGALGSRGALLLADYEDDPGNRGIAVSSGEDIAHEAARALRAGLQVCVHAIGDSANRLVLDAYERALREAGPARFPLRIEHVQVLDEADLLRFAALGVVPSVQPSHCTSDMYWAEARLGPRRVRGAYRWRSLLLSGAFTAGGSDAPVERPDPIQGIYAACTRRDAAGRPSSQQDITEHFVLPAGTAPNPDRYADGWYGTERVSRIEAIRMFTGWAARAAGMDDILGSLEAGKYADFVVLSKDISSVPDQEILQTEILATYIGGKIRHRK